ncbi:MAG: STAS-like domain-containing protein [Thermoanaerobaculaceae bacterium]|nr:STAS-like domain-containing protein [Thermoanaerobaculaceae bacterium]
MTENLIIKVYEVVGSEHCVASSDGQIVFDRVLAALEKQKKVTLSFLNVTALTSAFLNAAIGQLYGRFDEKTIKKLLSVKDLQKDDLALLKRVVDTAKAYFKDPDKFEKALKDAEKEF